MGHEQQHEQHQAMKPLPKSLNSVMWLLDALPVLSANMYLQVPLVDYLLSYVEILVHQNAHSHQQK